MRDGPPALVAAARSRLAPLALYPKPLRADVEVVVWPWLFRLPHLRRYAAYAFVRRIVLAREPDALIGARGRDWLEDLLVHELCHLWQHQHHPVRMFLALVRYRYDENPFELEARAAARASRPLSQPATSAPSAGRPRRADRRGPRTRRSCGR